jgi:hypothetical protein
MFCSDTSFMVRKKPEAVIRGYLFFSFRGCSLLSLACSWTEKEVGVICLAVCLGKRLSVSSLVNEKPPPKSA